MIGWRSLLIVDCGFTGGGGAVFVVFEATPRSAAPGVGRVRNAPIDSEHSLELLLAREPKRTTMSSARCRRQTTVPSLRHRPEEVTNAGSLCVCAS